MSKEKPTHFIEEIIKRDLDSGKHAQVITRFPPEPNGYLHIGHAKSICLNFGLSQTYGGKTYLRFDDTNPITEDTEYVNSIKEDIRWLGFQWDEERYASDYFSQLYNLALQLIDQGKAYVDDSTSEEIAKSKGTPQELGTNSPCRDRPIKVNRRLFEEMKDGIHPDGSKVLRAKIDMAHPNLLMRDPVLYRIKRAFHHRTQNQWCIYPMYDFAHGQSDAIEGITHSLCTLEFAPHRALYDWFIHQLGIYPSRQYEFARLQMTHTVMSKRKLLQLVKDQIVNGWDDPRMPTISGLRRRGYTAESIREFSARIGVAKRDNLIDVKLLEFCLREQLNKTVERRMVIARPLKVHIVNYPEKKTEWLKSENNPEAEHKTTRELPFSAHLWIEQDDFNPDPPKKYYRLSPGQYVRLKSAYIIRCDDVIKNQDGTIHSLKCTYFPDSKSGADTSNIPVKGIIQWVSEPHAVPCQLRLYDHLFITKDMNTEDGDIKQHLNANSLQVLTHSWAEPTLLDAKNEHFQFLRLGYFYPDTDSKPSQLIFNRTVTLRDRWTK